MLDHAVEYLYSCVQWKLHLRNFVQPRSLPPLHRSSAVREVPQNLPASLHAVDFFASWACRAECAGTCLNMQRTSQVPISGISVVRHVSASFPRSVLTICRNVRDYFYLTDARGLDCNALLCHACCWPQMRQCCLLNCNRVKF